MTTTVFVVGMSRPGHRRAFGKANPGAPSSRNSLRRPISPVPGCTSGSVAGRGRAGIRFRVDLHEQRGEQEEIGEERQDDDKRGEPAHPRIELETGEADHDKADY